MPQMGAGLFSRHLESSGELYTPRTARTLRDTPSIEELSSQGVWD